MGIEKALTNGIGISISVNEAMMIPMLRGPLQSRLLKSRGPEKEQEKTNHAIGFVGGMGKEPVVSNCDTKTRRCKIEQKQGDLGRGNSMVVGVDRRAYYAGQSGYGEERNVHPIVLSRCACSHCLSRWNSFA